MRHARSRAVAQDEQPSSGCRTNQQRGYFPVSRDGNPQSFASGHRAAILANHRAYTRQTTTTGFFEPAARGRKNLSFPLWNYF